MATVHAERTTTCATCGGAGVIEVTQHSRDADGHLRRDQVARKCTACQGTPTR